MKPVEGYNKESYELEIPILDRVDPYWFARWLNFYFEPWNPDDGTWIGDSRKGCAYSTDELLELFTTKFVQNLNFVK